MEKFATLRSQLGILQAFGWESPVMLITLDGKSWSGLGRLVVEGDKDLEGAAFTHNAGDVDCAVVFFNDPAGKGKAEAGAIAAGGVEGAKDLRELSFRDATAGVADGDAGKLIF